MCFKYRTRAMSFDGEIQFHFFPSAFGGEQINTVQVAPTVATRANDKTNGAASRFGLCCVLDCGRETNKPMELEANIAKK